MKKYILFIIALIFTCIGHSQDFEKEIKNLKTPEEINKYWENIRELDQSKRGLNSDSILDNNNYKKVILLIKYHGYPKGSIIPNLIAVHQNSRYVNEYYFPIFYQAYKNGEADSFWFLHSLRGLHRERFGRDLIRNNAITVGTWSYYGHQLSPKDMDTVVKRLSKFLNKKVDFSIQKFDSLFEKYYSDVRLITNSELLDQWLSNENTRYYFYKFQNKIYYQKIYPDNSFGFPIEIKFNKEKNQYEYLEWIDNDFFIIDDNKNLQIYESGKLIEEAKIIH